MARIKSDGVCYHCGSKVSKTLNSISKHINDCYKPSFVMRGLNVAGI